MADKRKPSLMSSMTKLIDNVNELASPVLSSQTDALESINQESSNTSGDSSANSSDINKPNIPPLDLDGASLSSGPNSAVQNAIKKTNQAMERAKGLKRPPPRQATSSMTRLLRTANELENERRSTMKVTGPLDQQWNNYGVGPADDDDQLIDTEQIHSPTTLMKIKNTVDQQVHQVVQEKRGWAYYEKHQPDYAAFKTEMKKVILELMGPVVNVNSAHGEEIDNVKMEQDKLSKRLVDVEFVYKRVMKNANAQQDALVDLETRSKALRVTEERLREQVKACEQIKHQLSEKFALLRDDRALIMKRIDHTDNEVNKYRKDMREMHDQMSKQLLNKVMETHKMSMQNLDQNTGLRTEHDELKLKFNNIFESDVRDTAVQVSKLHELFIEVRKQITALDKALVTKFDWEGRNKLYDHEINILAAATNEIRATFREDKEDSAKDLPLIIQEQIDSTLLAVLGNRKKYVKLLKDHQKTFYEKHGQDEEALSDSQNEEGEGESPDKSKSKRRKSPIKPQIDLNSDDPDSDNSIDRMQGFLEELHTKGKLNIGGVGGGGLGAIGGGAAVSKEDLLNVLNAHDEKKYDQVRSKFITNMPIRRQARYHEHNDKFVPAKNSKLRVLRNKQVWSFNNLSVYKHMNLGRTRRNSGSGSLSYSSKSGQRTGKGRLQINPSRSKLHQLTLPPKAMQKEGSSKFNASGIQFDKVQLQTLFDKLANSSKFKIASQLNKLLKAETSKNDIQLLKVKQSTIENTILGYEAGSQTNMTQLQSSAIVQLLALDKILDANGNAIKTDYFEKKRAIIEQMIQLENASSEANSSQDSRRRQANFGLRPPMIQMEALETNREKQRSKTLAPSLMNRSSKKREMESETSSLEESTLQPKGEEEQDAQQPKFQGVKKDLLPDLKSVRSESVSSKGQSTLRNKKANLIQTQQSFQKLEPEKLESNPATAKLPKIPVPVNDGFEAAVNAATTEMGQHHLGQGYATRDADSYDFPDDTATENSRNGSEGGLDDPRNFEPPPQEVEVPTTDEILVKMKDQIDELSSTVKERTQELRDLQKYVSRLEQSTVSAIESNIRQIQNKMDYDKADLKDLIHQRMCIIGDKIVTNNKKMLNNKESAQSDNFATQRKMKAYGRQVDNRIDEVLNSHHTLMSKYSFLIRANDYFVKMAEQVIQVTELNTVLLRSDEQDKNNICLMGSKGAKSLKEQQMAHTQKRIQQMISQQDHDSEVAATAQRPQTGVSGVSQRSSYPMSLKSQQTKNDHEDTHVIQVDKRCQTCSDDRGQLIQLFKIACLAYHPSKVEYQGIKYPKSSLIQKQEDQVNELKNFIKTAASAAAEKFQNDKPYVPIVQAKIQQLKTTTDQTETEEEMPNLELETQVNSGQGGAHLSSDTRSRQGQNEQQILSSQGHESEFASADKSAPLAHHKRKSGQLSFTNLAKVPQQSSIRKPDNKKAEMSPSIRFAASPQTLQTEILTDGGTQTNQMSIENTQAVHKISTKPINQVKFSTKEATVVADSQAKMQQSHHVTVPATHTSFRFNASHELLQYNQEQILKIVPSPLRSGSQVDEKLLKIQKLKEKALMIQLSREVNQPNSFIAGQYNPSAKTPQNLQSQSFFSKEQHDKARDVARMKHEKETQIMIDTRERFTKRFQFEKVSHQLLSNTPSNTHLSGSQHNDLVRYDSKTIFRQAKPGQTDDQHQSHTYAALIGNKSPSLPNLTRNMSATQYRHNMTSEEVFSDRVSRVRAQRPISSMNFNNEKASQPFWRTQRQSDGVNRVVINRKRMRSGLDWNQHRQSSGTEQINKMLQNNPSESFANFSSQ